MNGDSQQQVEISVQLLGGDNIAAEDIDRMTRALRDEIEECAGTEGVNLKPGGPAPDGSKAAAEAITVGASVLAVIPAMVPPLIDYLKEWALRPGHSPIKINARVESSA